MNKSFWMAAGLMIAGTASAWAGAEKVTYAEHVAPILNASCVECHRAGEIGPMALTSYQDVRPWAKSIKEVVHTRTMPPWHADSSKVAYANDRSLTDEQIATLVAWADQGAPMGDPSKIPALPQFDETWAMGEPDMIFHATEDFTIRSGEGNIDYQSIYFGPVLEEDIYVTGWEIRPSERSLVHHANLVRAPVQLPEVGIGQAVLAGGDYIGSYLPGARPMMYPEGTALRIPKGNMIQIQVHYVPTDGEPLTDHLMFGVRLANGRVDKLMRTVGTDEYEIEIAPHGTFEMDSEVLLNFDLTLLSSGAHMHLRGDAYTAKAILPDGTEKLIADVPFYDFNWQSNYQLANPVDVPKGTKYHVHARWDNTANRPTNDNPDLHVVYGEWTENEMLTTWSHAVLTNEKLGLKCENGRVVGKFEDAQETPHPFILQTLPNTFKKPKDTPTEVSQASAEAETPAAAETTEAQ